MVELTARNHIDAPIDFVFAHLSDFDRIGKVATERGLGMEPLDAQEDVGRWRLTGDIRGREIDTTVRLTEQTPPNSLHFSGSGSGFHIETKLRLTEDSPTKTRLETVITVTPKTIKARLLETPLRLAAGRIEGRMERGLDQYGAQIAERYSRSA